jgi:hypothetical protein
MLACHIANSLDRSLAECSKLPYQLKYLVLSEKNRRFFAPPLPAVLLGRDKGKLLGENYDKE